MRVADENRMAAAEENRVRTVEWDVEHNRRVEVERDYTERESFIKRTVSGGATIVEQPAWAGDRTVFTVAEVRRQSLVGVRVVCPRDVVRDGIRVATLGQVLSWAEALGYGVVE